METEKDMVDLSFYKGKKVLITGHTGFKGSWLCKLLIKYGAQIVGYALEPTTEFSLFNLLELSKQINSITGDIRDYEHLKKVFDIVHPELVIHMAAQPIVRESYKNPRYTYETNVMGTVHILECLRNNQTVKSFINVTTDKVYRNKEWEWGYRENDEMDGYDPYSNSKSCSELVTHSYARSFFIDNAGNRTIPISTVRAGNVIGGGDFAKDRIIPDCVRAAVEKEDILVRNPYSTRPYQHVLEPLFAYLMIAQRQYEDSRYASSYNVGPNDSDCLQTGAIVDLFIKYWGNELKWINQYDGGRHEANVLKLDCSKLKNTFGWKPRWNIEEAIQKTVEWSKVWIENKDISLCIDKQIDEFINRGRSICFKR